MHKGREGRAICALVLVHGASGAEARLAPITSHRITFSSPRVVCDASAGVIPDVVRSDQGAEITSKANDEFLALCGVRHIKGSAHTPRHQSPVERIQNHLILLNAVCATCPQEWPSPLLVLEYLYECAPRSPSPGREFRSRGSCGRAVLAQAEAGCGTHRCAGSSGPVAVHSAGAVCPPSRAPSGRRRHAVDGQWRLVEKSPEV